MQCFDIPGASDHCVPKSCRGAFHDSETLNGIENTVVDEPTEPINF
jgi:hypothetical protein